MSSLTRFARCSVVAFAVFVAACDSLFENATSPRIELELADAAFVAGDEVHVTVRNVSEHPWHYMAGCGTGFQRKDGDAWVMVYQLGGCPSASIRAIDGPASEWILNPLAIAPNEQIVVSFLLPADASAGQYRVRTNFSATSGGEGAGFSVSTASFAVAGSGGL